MISLTTPFRGRTSRFSLDFSFDDSLFGPSQESVYTKVKREGERKRGEDSLNNSEHAEHAKLM